MQIDINFKGFRSTLMKFESDGYNVQGTHWRIARGGYDLWWEIYYDSLPVIGCVAGEVENYGHLSNIQYAKACEIIKECYGNSVKIEKI